MQKLKILLISLLLIGLDLNCKSDIQSVEIDETDLPEPNDSMVAYVSTEEGLGIHIRITADYQKSFNISGGYAFDAEPAWSPDKQFIVFSRGDFVIPLLQIWIMGYDGAEKHRISPDTLDCQGPAWSPDGEKILFRGVPVSGEVRPGQYSSLYSINIDGSNLIEITDESIFPSLPFPIRNYGFPDWLPDGNSIIFTYHRADNGPRGIGIIDLVTKDFHQFPGIEFLLPYQAQWSPTRDEIVFTGVNNDSSYVYRVRRDGSELLRLTPAATGEPDWSPDGNKIIYQQIDPKGDIIEMSIWIVNREGTERKQILKKNIPIGSPAW